MRNSIVRAVFFVLSLVYLSSCGSDPKQDCQANFMGQGLSLKISIVSSQTYRFELCGDSKISYPAFSVYGAVTESEISDLSILGRYRLSHVNAKRSGDTFEVTFSSDLYFVIFADTSSGGSLQYSNATELIRGGLSQITANL